MTHVMIWISSTLPCKNQNTENAREHKNKLAPFYGTQCNTLFIGPRRVCPLKRHLDRFISFYTAHWCDCPTDRQTTLLSQRQDVCSNSPHSMLCMRRGLKTKWILIDNVRTIITTIIISSDDREISFLLQWLSVLIQRNNAVLRQDSFVKEEEE